MVLDDDSDTFIYPTGHGIIGNMDETDALPSNDWRLRPEDFNLEDMLLYMDVLEQGHVRLILEVEQMLREMNEDTGHSTNES